MEHGVSCFPLLQLPNGPLKCVLHNMELFHQIGFSILSKRSKELVKSLNLEVLEISVSIGFLVNMKVQLRNQLYLHWSFYTEELRDDMAARKYPSLTKMYTPDFIETYNPGDRVAKKYEWKKQGFEIKDWINHMISIFHRSKLDKLSFMGRTSFEFDSLQRAISDVAHIKIDDRCPVTYNKRIAQTYPTAKQLTVYFRVTAKLEDYHFIFCQGLDNLTICSLDHHNLLRWKLDDLLLMNSQSIKVNHSNLSQRDVNKFLQHWINGTNPRMEHLAIRFRRIIAPSEETILRGLNHQVAPPDQRRLFKKPGDGSSTLIVKGGYDIQREDGTTATIIFREGRHNQSFSLEVFVWH